jgi:succinoglycan biosynthesis protein ExoA
MEQMEDAHISVVVSCRNEIRHIRAFLESLFRQELGGMEMEVLIADGMSDDGTRMVLAEFEKRFAALRVFDNPEKIAATGLNRAIREAQGEIILRMDAHTIYAANYVRSCLEVLKETNADNVGGPALTRADGYLAQAIAHAFHAPFAVGGAKFRDPQYEGPASTVPYGCWRKSTLECIGLFDVDMVRGQDDELNFRILSSGGTVWQSPKIVSWYQPRTSLSALFWQYFQNGFWKVAAVRKHRRPASL